MNRWRAVLLLGVAGALLLTGASIGAGGGTPPAPAGDLAAQIEELKSKVRSLDERLKVVEDRQALLAIPRDAMKQLAPNEAPRGWTKFQYEGETFWLVPLEDGSPSGSPRGK